MQTLLDSIRGLITLSPEEEVFVRNCFKPQTIKPKEHFLQEGKICRHVGFISRGLVRYYTTVGGEERTMSFNREGEFICYYPSFLHKQLSEVAIQAVEQTDLLVISSEALQEFYRYVQMGERFGRMAIEQVFLSAIQEMRSLYADKPPERYRRFLKMQPDLVQRIPQHYIASFVGVKPQSLSRIRRRLTFPAV